MGNGKSGWDRQDKGKDERKQTEERRKKEVDNNKTKRQN